MGFTVIIGTYGADSWKQSGLELAQHVADNHRVAAVHFHVPDGTIARARNMAVDVADAAGFADGWLCFLDADDDLAPGYFDSMAAQIPDGSGWDLWAPAVQFDDQPPVVLDDRDIDTINPCVIGTLIHRETFEQAERFWEEPAWEDWSLFRRAWMLGADVHHVPDAVYLATTNPQGRNSTVQQPHALHRRIIRTHREWFES